MLLEIGKEYKKVFTVYLVCHKCNNEFDHQQEISYIPQKEEDPNWRTASFASGRVHKFTNI